MKKHILNALIATALTVTGSFVMSGCAKEEHGTAPDSTKSNVKLENGRLVFKDQKALDETVKSLFQKSSKKMSEWEQSLNFTSLRSKSVDNVDNKDAAGLMAKFGFPPSYASIINEKGEYQIGSKVYWFNGGFKHEASSEEELELIKRDPSTSKIKFQAGSRPGRNITAAAIANTGSLRTGNVDWRYISPFYYKPSNQYTTGTYRVVFATQCYTEARGFPNYYTAISMPLFMQFQAPGYDWYTPGTGDYRYFSYNLNMYSNVSYQGGDRTYINQSYYFNNPEVPTYSGDTQIELAQANVIAPAGNYSYSPSNVEWNYDLYGSISAVVPTPGGAIYRYSVDGGPNMLW